MKVIDASALSAIVLREEGWEDLLDLDDLFLSVDFAPIEAMNAVWKAAVRGRIAEEDAFEAVSILLELVKGNIELRSSQSLSKEALRLGFRHNITIYDSLYVVLARMERLPLVSLDEKQRAVAALEGVKVQP